MPTVPNGPVADVREPAFASWGLWQTVGPSRVLVRCSTPITAMPELENGIVLAHWHDTEDNDEPAAIYRGFTGFNDFTLNYLKWNDPILGDLWQAALLATIPPTVYFWQAGMLSDRWPRAPFDMLSVGGFVDVLHVTPLSEWVVVGEMFPMATLTDEFPPP